MKVENKKDRFASWGRPFIEDNKDTPWGWRVRHTLNFFMGDKVDIGYGTYIQAGGFVTIGDNVQIGGGCKIYSVDSEGDQEGEIRIGDSAVIGANSVILPNVTIGEHAKVGALSLVKAGTIIGAHETWVGTPARRIK